MLAQPFCRCTPRPLLFIVENYKSRIYGICLFTTLLIFHSYFTYIPYACKNYFKCIIFLAAATSPTIKHGLRSFIFTSVNPDFQLQPLPGQRWATLITHLSLCVVDLKQSGEVRMLAGILQLFKHYITVTFPFFFYFVCNFSTVTTH